MRQCFLSNHKSERLDSLISHITQTGLASQVVAVHTSARALNARCFHMICTFGLPFIHMDCDILPW